MIAARRLPGPPNILFVAINIMTPDRKKLNQRAMIIEVVSEWVNIFKADTR